MQSLMRFGATILLCLACSNLTAEKFQYRGVIYDSTRLNGAEGMYTVCFENRWGFVREGAWKELTEPKYRGLSQFKDKRALALKSMNVERGEFSFAWIDRSGVETPVNVMAQSKLIADPPVWYSPGSVLRTVARAGTMLRSEPSINAAAIGCIPLYSPVRIKALPDLADAYTFEGIRGYWVKVDWYGAEGWIFDGLLTALPLDRFTQLGPEADRAEIESGMYRSRVRTIEELTGHFMLGGPGGEYRSLTTVNFRRGDATGTIYAQSIGVGLHEACAVLVITTILSNRTVTTDYYFSGFRLSEFFWYLKNGNYLPDKAGFRDGTTVLRYSLHSGEYSRKGVAKESLFIRVLPAGLIHLRLPVSEYTGFM